MLKSSFQEPLDLIKSSHQLMVKQLHQFCEINSGTDHISGLRRMHKVLQSTFTPIADEIITKPLQPTPIITMAGETTMQPCGDALFIRKRPELTRRIILSGHMDTVYNATHPFQTLTYINDNTINGPGVADMKGGLIVMFHALNAFEKTPVASTLGWDVLINADEETGSLSSAHLIDSLAPDYKAALVYEPAMNDQGTLAKNRKGSGKITIIATGKAAHAGRAFHEGHNAICYLAEVLLEINALNGKREGVTINIGKIAGGNALNVVPDKAVAKLDIRISRPDDEAWVIQSLQNIKDNLSRCNHTLTLEGSFGRPVKRIRPATERLFKRIQRLGLELGLTIDWKDSGGCCDGNNFANYGLPVIDTLGVRGGNIHSPDEYILLDSLAERASLSTLLLVDLATSGLEALSE